MILSAQTIWHRFGAPEDQSRDPAYDGLIRPFSQAKQACGMSYGLSSCGYDIRVGKIDRQETIPYPERNDEQRAVGHMIGEEYQLNKHKLLRPVQAHSLRPGEFILCSSLEYMEIPHDVAGKVHDKSTLARQGLALQNTILEPGWKGHITLELSNHGPKALSIRVGQPIAQVVFEFLDHATELPYIGKYQDQPAEPVHAILAPSNGGREVDGSLGEEVGSERPATDNSRGVQEALSPRVPCRVCNGSGDQGDPGHGYKACRTCGGTGYLVDSDERPQSVHEGIPPKLGGPCGRCGGFTKQPSAVGAPHDWEHNTCPEG